MKHDEKNKQSDEAKAKAKVDAILDKIEERRSSEYLQDLYMPPRLGYMARRQSRDTPEKDQENRGE